MPGPRPTAIDLVLGLTKNELVSDPEFVSLNNLLLDLAGRHQTREVVGASG